MAPATESHVCHVCRPPPPPSTPLTITHTATAATTDWPQLTLSETTSLVARREPGVLWSLVVRGEPRVLRSLVAWGEPGVLWSLVVWREPWVLWPRVVWPERAESSMVTTFWLSHVPPCVICHSEAITVPIDYPLPSWALSMVTMPGYMLPWRPVCMVAKGVSRKGDLDYSLGVLICDQYEHM